MRSGLYIIEFHAGGTEIAKFNAILLDGIIALFSKDAKSRGTYAFEDDELKLEIHISGTALHGGKGSLLAPSGSTIVLKGRAIKSDTAFEANGKLPGSGSSCTCSLKLLDPLDPVPELSK